MWPASSPSREQGSQTVAGKIHPSIHPSIHHVLVNMIMTWYQQFVHKDEIGLTKTTAAVTNIKMNLQQFGAGGTCSNTDKGWTLMCQFVKLGGNYLFQAGAIFIQLQPTMMIHFTESSPHDNDLKLDDKNVFYEGWLCIFWRASLKLFKSLMMTTQVWVPGKQPLWQIVLPYPFENLG